VAAAHRVSHEPAYVLHRYDWSESSLILEVFTRHHGRIALVAKGAKRPSSNFRPVLLPLQPLQLNYGGDAEIRTLKGAEWMGGHVMPTGEALLSGYYVNELLLRLLARDDAHEALFDAYAGVVQVLASDHAGAQAATQAAALRAFELLLLREVGLLPSLDAQTLTLEPLVADALQPGAEAGLRLAGDGRGRAGRRRLAVAARRARRPRALHRHAARDCHHERRQQQCPQKPAARLAQLPLRRVHAAHAAMMRDLQAL
jgi:DNA repair protein RecO (recombination protein O)